MGSLKLDVPVGVIRRGAARGARVRIRESVRLAIAVQKGSYRSHARNTQARLVTCCALFTKHKLTYLALRKWRGRHMATHRLDRGSGALSVGVAVIVVEQRARGAAGRRVHLLVLRPIIAVAVVRSVNVVLVVIGRSIAVGSLLRRFLASPRTFARDGLSAQTRPFSHDLCRGRTVQHGAGRDGVLARGREHICFASQRLRSVGLTRVFAARQAQAFRRVQYLRWLALGGSC